MLDPHIGKWPETLMRHLGFTEIVPKAPVPGLRDFIIEVERSDIPHNKV